MDSHTIFTIILSALGAAIYNKLMHLIFKYALDFESHTTKNVIIITLNIPALILSPNLIAKLFVTFSSILALVSIVKDSKKQEK
jgi:hypothetical protein